MAGKDYRLITSILTVSALLTNQITFAGIIRPPAVPPFASTLNVYLSPPPPPLLHGPLALPLPPPPPPALPLNPFFLPPSRLLPSPSVFGSLPLLPGAPLLPPPYPVNGIRFFSSKGTFPSLSLPAFPPVLPAPAFPALPAAFPAPAFPGLPPPAYPALPPPAFPALPAPALPAAPPPPPALLPGFPAYPGFPGTFGAGLPPLPFR